MGAQIPKQYLQIEGKPILRHTIERFLSLEQPVHIIVVVGSEHKEWWKEYCRKSGFITRYDLPSGGMTRFHSVQNALKYLEDGAVVAVHDGVRPLVTPEFLERMYRDGEEYGAAIPAVAPADSIRETGLYATQSFPVDRSKIRLVQTPQVFHTEILKESYRLPYRQDFTDDASVVEAAGYRVTLVDGQPYNIKITTPEDLKIAGSLLL